MSTVTNPWRCSLDLLSEPIIKTPWLLHELLPTESVILMSGREGTMKTWNALDWAFSIAQGQPWLNRESQAGSVLYLDAENPQKVFCARLLAIGGSKNLNIWRWQDSDFPSALNDPRLIEGSSTT